MSALYDSIGHGYADMRKPDPRIKYVLDQGLAGSKSVLNVGAGAGSYSPEARAQDARPGLDAWIGAPADATHALTPGRTETLTVAPSPDASRPTCRSGAS